MERSKEERLQLALDAAGMGTFVWYVEDRTEPDQRMLELFNLPLDGTLSLEAALATMIHPDDRVRYADAVAAALDPAGGRELREDIRVMQAHGGYHWLAITARAFFEGEPLRPARLVGVASNVTDRYDAEDRRAFLFDVTETLRALNDPLEIQARAAELLGVRLGVSRVLYLEVEHERDSDYYVAGRGYVQPGVANLVGRYRADDFGASLFEGWRAGHTIAVADVTADQRLTDSEREYYPATGIQAFAAVPLLKNGSHVALLILHQTTRRVWAANEIALVEEVAERTWAAVERAQAEKELRESELRFREVVEVTPQLVWVGRFDGSVEFANENWIVTTGLDPAGRDHRSMLSEAAHPDERADLLRDWAQAEAAGRAFETELRLRQRIGDRRWFLVRIVPLNDVAGSVVKWFGVATDIDDRRRADEILREQEVRARQEEHRIAVELQRSLLPRAIASSVDVHIGARYEAGGVALEVGGDWYDTFTLPDGRTALTVGDVVGHGLTAAITMGTLRVAMAALAPHYAGPGALLSQFDQFAQSVDGADFATACYATFDPATGVLEYASAGHPPMLVINGDGSARWLTGGRSGPLNGTVDSARPDAVDRLDPGSLLVLYSDGLIERRQEPITLGLRRLEHAAAELRELPVDEFCPRLIETLGGDQRREDDVVVLCLRVPWPAFHFELQPDPTQLRTLRQRLAEWGARQRIDAATMSGLTLAIGEATANAIEHAYRERTPSPIEVAVRPDERGGLDVIVRDAGTWRAPSVQPADRGRGTAIMRRLTEGFQRRSTALGTTVQFRLPRLGSAS